METTQEIEEAVNNNIEQNKGSSARLMQLATDATRIISFAGEKLTEIKESGFFTRIRELLFSGRNSPSSRMAQVPEVTKEEFEQMKAFAFKTLEALNERNLLAADAIITVKNNLNTLDVKQQEIKQAVIKMAQRVSDRFEKLENRVSNVEESQRLDTWISGIEVDDRYGVLPETIRFLKIVKDYYSRKPCNYSRDELLLLRKALRYAGLDFKKQVSLGEIMDSLILELQDFDEQKYLEITRLEIKDTSLLTGKKLSNILAVPSFVSIVELPESKRRLQPMVELLQEEGDLATDYATVLQKVVRKDVAKRNNIDMNIKMPLCDLGIELISCYSALPSLLDESSSGSSGSAKTAYAKSALFCPECGAKLDSDSAFCPECGTKVE